MKTLIALLVVALFAGCKTYAGLGWGDTEEQKRVSGIDKHTLVLLWHEYKAACYADSVRQDHCTNIQTWGCETCTDSTYTFCGGGSDLVLIMSTIPRYYWTHREPTFPDFVEWLEGTQ